MTETAPLSIKGRAQLGAHKNVDGCDLQHPIRDFFHATVGVPLNGCLSLFLGMRDEIQGRQGYPR